MKKNKKTIDFCLVGEPSNPNTLGEMIKIGRRWSLNVDLKVFGTQGHVAYPKVANNPITHLLKMLTSIKSNNWDNGSKHFDPSNFEAVIRLANVLEEKGEDGAALSLVEDAIDPSSTDVRSDIMKLKLSLSTSTPVELAHQIDMILEKLSESDCD